MRIEKDMIGERELPDEVYYGVHTLRSIENFSLSGMRVNWNLLKAMALVKKAAAETNGELGYLDRSLAAAISQACDEVAAGRWKDEFVTDALQGGAGTSTNMNMNEVVAARANEILSGSKMGPIHPLDHVNMHQSTNDVYPTALRIAAIWLVQELSQACARLQESLQGKEAEFAGVIKVGRTEMQDALPITLGQEFSAYAQAIARDRWRLYKVEERLRQVNLGGTAVGTGLNAPKKFAFGVTEKIRGYSGLGLARAENTIDVTQNADVFVEVSGLVKALAVNLSKIAHDLRLLSSGPRAGFGEISLPERQAGSSIMPGKVNPVIAEAVNQASFHVMAADFAVTLAAQSGQLELNAFLPLIAHHLLGSLEILISTVDMFKNACIDDIRANEEQCRILLDRSIVSVTALSPHLGYEEATMIAKKAFAERKTVRVVAEETGLLTPEELDVILNPRELTRQGIAGEKRMKIVKE